MNNKLTKDIYNIYFYCSDLNKGLTIKEYFKELLKTLFKEGESFSGKKPFGNSGWEYDLIFPLVFNKIIAGKIDSDNYVMSYDSDEYEEALDFLLNNF